MKIANNTANTKKRKGIAALANRSSCKRDASKNVAKRMRATIKATRDLLFEQTVNLMHDSENGPVKRAPYGSMQVAIDFLALHGHAGIEPHQISYYRDKKKNKQPVPAGHTFSQTTASTDMSTHEQKTAASTEVSLSTYEQQSHAINLAGSIAPPADLEGIMTDSTLKSGQPRGTTVAEVHSKKSLVEECTAAIVTRYHKEKEDNKNNRKKYLK